MKWKKAWLLTNLAWLIFILIMALVYAHNRLNSPVADPGYETTWSFQLLMFSFFRLPIYLVALIVVLWLEKKYLSPSAEKTTPRE